MVARANQAFLMARCATLAVVFALGATVALTARSLAASCDLCLMQVGQKIRINADQHGVMIYCRTFQQAVAWDESFGGDGSMCHNRKVIGHVFTIVAKRIVWRDGCSIGPSVCDYAVYTISDGATTAYTLDGGGDVYVNGKWTGPF
jgi:hypothetical protein